MASDKLRGIYVLTTERVQQAFKKACEEYVPTGGRFELITEKYYEAAKQVVISSFANDEPVSKSFGLKWDSPGAISFWDSILIQNISTALVDEDTDEIMAVRFVKWEPRDSEASLLEDGDPALSRFLRFARSVASGYTLADHFPYEEMYHLLGLATSHKYRKHRYATQLMEFTTLFLRNLQLPNCHLLKTEATSAYSQKIFESLGFRCFHKKMYADYEEDGEVVLKAMDEHTCMKILARYL